MTIYLLSLICMTSNQISEYRKELLSYTTGMVIPKQEIMNLPQTVKLQILQITPKKAVKTRRVWWKEIPYVDIWYIERALNFISNFSRWVEVKREWYKEYQKWEKTIYDAWVLWHFRIELDGKRIERSCYWTRQMYSNPAVSDYAVLEAARSMATKSFADTLWVASDKLALENQALQEARKTKEESNMDDLIDWFTSNTNNGK